MSRKGKDGVQICSHSRIIVYPFGVEKSRLHEDQVRSSRSSVGNDADVEMAIQERSSFFKPCIAIVIGVTVLTIAIKRSGIAVAVAVAVTSPRFVGIAVNFASSTDRHSSITITVALHVLDFVYFDIVHNPSGSGGTGDHGIVGGYVRVIGIVKFDSSVEQGTRSATEKSGRK